MKILQKSCTHLSSTEFNQVCTESLLTLSLTIYHGTGPCLIAEKTQHVRGKSQANTITESSLESALSIPQALSFTPHSEFYEVGAQPHLVHRPQRLFSQGLKAIRWWNRTWNLGLPQPMPPTIGLDNCPGHPNARG